MLNVLQNTLILGFSLKLQDLKLKPRLSVSDEVKTLVESWGGEGGGAKNPLLGKYRGREGDGVGKGYICTYIRRGREGEILGKGLVWRDGKGKWWGKLINVEKDGKEKEWRKV